VAANPQLEGAERIRTAVRDFTSANYKSLHRAAVYFIQAGTSGPIKIGTAQDPQSRLVRLQTANPWPLYSVLLIWAPAGLERELHRLLAEHRIRGEWFRPHADVWAAIEECHEEYVIAHLIASAKRTAA
jgi:hypothetical protein